MSEIMVGGIYEIDEFITNSNLPGGAHFQKIIVRRISENVTMSWRNNQPYDVFDCAIAHTLDGEFEYIHPMYRDSKTGEWLYDKSVNFIRQIGYDATYSEAYQALSQREKSLRQWGIQLEEISRGFGSSLSTDQQLAIDSIILTLQASIAAVTGKMETIERESWMKGESDEPLPTDES
jgi:hypothetical protein